MMDGDILKLVEAKASGHETPRVKFIDELMSAADLQQQDFPPVKYVIPGYLPEGLTILAGKPKRGKSWMALDWGLAVSSGGVAFGSIKCEQGPALYLALEDNRRRLQRRIHQLLGNKRWPSSLAIQTNWPRLKNGGLDLIEQWLDANPDARLVILDTLQKVREPRARGQGFYEADYDSISPLQTLAGERGIAILIIHHLKKAEAEDPLDQVSGSTGLTGAADTVLVLDKDSEGVRLYGRGRDIDEFEMAISFDKVTGRWAVLGNAAEVFQSDQRRKIVELLKGAGETLGPKEIAESTGVSYEVVRQLLPKMVMHDLIEKVGRGEYRFL